jgi:hypothetical protein
MQETYLNVFAIADYFLENLSGYFSNLTQATDIYWH